MPVKQKPKSSISKYRIKCTTQLVWKLP